MPRGSKPTRSKRALTSSVKRNGPAPWTTQSAQSSVGTAAEPVPEAVGGVATADGTLNRVAASTATRAASTLRRSRCRALRVCAKGSPSGLHRPPRTAPAIGRMLPGHPGSRARPELRVRATYAPSCGCVLRRAHRRKPGELGIDRNRTVWQSPERRHGGLSYVTVLLNGRPGGHAGPGVPVSSRDLDASRPTPRGGRGDGGAVRGMEGPEENHGPSARGLLGAFLCPPP